LTFPESDYAQPEDETEIGDKRQASETKITVRNAKSNPEITPNTVRFTANQVEAIRSSLSKGLSLVVSHPGAGEFDLATQILLGLYLNHPGQNSVVVCENDAELDVLCSKLQQRFVDTKHILRFGRELDFVDIHSVSTWGKSGRIEAFLAAREELLGVTNALAASLSIAGAYGDNCTNATFFFSHIIRPKWEEYHKKNIKKRPKLETVISNFPFSAFFDTEAQKVFEDKTVDEAIETATAYYASLEATFNQIEGVRAFELLRGNNDRANYIIVKEARIVAMTARHAAEQRRELVRLGFKYHSIIVMQAGRMPEIEAVIPMLLQSPDIKHLSEEDGKIPDSRLERVVVIGDRHQLPSRVRSRTLCDYASLDQSLVERLCRLGVPSVELDSVTGYRPSLVELFKWKYPQIQHIDQQLGKERNAGFVHDYQFINVPDYEGAGETQPRAGFYQNLGEAEYVVSLYQYMRLIG
jgi:intron-binding protein aquarius